MFIAALNVRIPAGVNAVDIVLKGEFESNSINRVLIGAFNLTLHQYQGKKVDYYNDTISFNRPLAYRYGFNGMEKDDEINGSGNSYTALFWQYDARLGRRWNLDPKPNPSISQYVTFANNPIWFSDPFGDTVKFVSNVDEQFVNNLLDKESDMYSRKFAKKFKRLQGSEKTYLFESINPGSKHKDGHVYADAKNKNLVHVKFTQGGTSQVNNPLNGFGEYRALFEETFHAWEHDKGKLDLTRGNIMAEARAWKFSTYAPGNIFTTTQPQLKGVTVITVIAQMNNVGIKQLGIMLRDGISEDWSFFNDPSYPRVYPSYYKKGTKVGIYNNLPWK